jgi:soluble lytic murein transglycosylase-like protein
MRIAIVILAAIFIIFPTVKDSHAYLDAQAAYQMALRHHNQAGRGKRNYNIAMLLYCRADADGHAGAAYAIGRMYESGQGFKRNKKKAAAWFHRAVTLGSKEAVWWRDETRRFRKGPARCPNGWGRGNKAKPRAPKEIRALVEKLAPKYGLDPKLVLAVVAVESSFLTHAVSSAKAQGLMQLIPATADRFGVRDPFNPEDNLRGGMAYLKWLLKRFKGSVPLALAGYNAGEGAVKRYGGIPPYKETQNYVRKIRRLYDKRVHPY